jgi:DNA primase
MLLRETDIIVVAFDNDEGGEKGWANAQEMSQKYDYPITKLLLEKDLDEVLVSDPKWLSSAIREAILKPPVLDHLKSLRTRLEGLSNEGQ